MHQFFFLRIFFKWELGPLYSHVKFQFDHYHRKTKLYIDYIQIINFFRQKLATHNPITQRKLKVDFKFLKGFK